jgi:hypothetical protein
VKAGQAPVIVDATVVVPRRRWMLAALVLAVAAAHALVVQDLHGRLQPLGHGSTGEPKIRRIDVAFVREVAPQAPPAVAPAPAAKPAPRAPSARVASSTLRKARPESKPKKDDSQNQADGASRDEDTAGTPTPVAIDGRAPELDDQELRRQAEEAAAKALAQRAAQDAEQLAVVVPPPVAAAETPSTVIAPSAAPTPAPSPASSSTRADGKPFEWPPSTQLNYTLTGNYRGEIHGSARVQWVRRGSRYQVHLDVVVGPQALPIMSRRMTSDGELGDQGLVPKRYEEVTRLALSTRNIALRFDGGEAVLANGSVVAAPSGMQDSASQFVQMAYLFTLDPSRLKAGSTITLPVALPRRVDNWIYDVVGEETLQTPVGAIQTHHVRPRRDVPKPGELSAQAWYAPTVRYLPVRILIRQDAETFVDLLLERLPREAEPAPVASPTE